MAALDCGIYNRNLKSFSRNLLIRYSLDARMMEKLLLEFSVSAILVMAK